MILFATLEMLFLFAVTFCHGSTSKQAYEQFLSHLPSSSKEWLYLVNLAIVDPYFSFSNLYLDRKHLGIGKFRALYLRMRHLIFENTKRIARSLRSTSAD